MSSLIIKQQYHEIYVAKKEVLEYHLIAGKFKKEMSCIIT